MRKQERIRLVFDELERRYAGADTELMYHTPFQLLIAVVMSAQATDKQVNKVTATLFERVKHPQDVLAMWLDAYREAIRSIGLYKSKAANVYGLSELLLSQEYNEKYSRIADSRVLLIYEQYGYYLPVDIKELQVLPGVGEKTAKVVSHVLYDTPVIAVDTHVHRVTNRLWIVKTTTPLQTSKQLETIVPEQYKSIAHHGLILFGRYHCTARKPNCVECPFVDFCRYGKNYLSWKL